MRKSSGIHEYHKWFNKGVKRWVEQGRIRTLNMIKKAVELDDFEPVDEYCNFSTSSTNVIEIFTAVSSLISSTKDVRLFCIFFLGSNLVEKLSMARYGE